VIFIRAPGYASPLDVFAWLFERGCELRNCRVFFDGYEWRGSGRVEATGVGARV
jgi:hypothetical protein